MSTETATLQRIDPADTPALFRRTAIEPDYQLYAHRDFNDIVCGCLLFALAADTIGTEAALQIVETESEADEIVPRLAKAAGLDEVYAGGLLTGWDAAGYSLAALTPLPGHEQCAESLGKLDGYAAFKALHHEPHPEELHRLADDGGPAL